MHRKDLAITESYEKKNFLESLIYSSKEKLSEDAYRFFFSKEELEKNMTVLNNEEAWLYQETDFVPKFVYDMKIKNIQEFMSPVIQKQIIFQEKKE